METVNPLIFKADINRIFDEKVAMANAATGRSRPVQKQTAKTSRTRPVKKRKPFSKGMGLDLGFLILVLVLLTIGTVMMFSASYPVALYEIGDSYYYLKRQLIFILVGVVAMTVVSFVDYHKFHKFCAVIMAVSYITLIAVLLIPSKTGVQRWIGFGDVFTIQASEIAKFAVIVFLAHWGSKYFNKMQTFKYGVLPGVIVFGTTAILLFLEPHYSCIVIVALLTIIMLYLSGIKLKWLVGAFIALAIVAVIAASTGMLTYAMSRMDGWGQALSYTEENKWDTYQTRNSLYAIGSGGLWGLGLGQSRQKYLFLPEPQNDFIFAIVCEELGLIGAAIILLIFALLVWRGITLSLRATDTFGKLLGMGLTAQIGLQVIMNIFVITDWLPNTGISLPFFSYGGSSLIMILAQMGIILSISRTANIEKA